MQKSSSARTSSPPPQTASQAATPASGRGAPIDPGRDHKLEPDVMDEEMAPADLVFVLAHLEFRRPNATAVVKIDKGVRDYLVRTLARHAPRVVR